MIRNGSGSESEFVYNPFGQRVLKIAKPRSGGVLSPQDQWTYTYYAYDANGQVMSVYDVKMSSTNNQASLDEQHLYGASRLGMIKPDLLLYDNAAINFTPNNPLENLVGQTCFEINNYLGNVNVVITDRRTFSSPAPGASIWEAVACPPGWMISNSDYYPFGMEMPGRQNVDQLSGPVPVPLPVSYNLDYRYAYNGMETDGEVSGDGNSYTTEFRQYDPRIGRWKSLDPLMYIFPSMSPYCAFDNNPIYFIDPYGLSAGGPPEGDPNATPAEPNTGYTCYDESTDKVLEYKGNGEWGNHSFGDAYKDEVHKQVLSSFYYENLGYLTVDEVVIKPGKPKGNENPQASELGALSEQFESKGPGTVSTGKGDSGGASYGSWQLASNLGRPQEFLNNEGSEYKSRFGNSKPGEAEFNKIWKEIAKEDPEGFKKAQHDYIKRTHYDVNKKSVDQIPGLNISDRSPVLLDVLWSTAVHHGPNNTIFQTALKGKNVSTMTDKDIILAVYAERGRVKPDGNLVYFSRNSKDVQKGVAARFKKESKKAIGKL